MMLLNGDAAIIEPRRGRREEALPSAGILAFTPQDLELLLTFVSRPQKRSHRLYLADVFTGMYADERIVVVGPSLGAPQTVLILEKLIALGVRDILALGWCGSLQPNVAIGDVVVPTGAVSEEGTSRHYPLAIARPGPADELLIPLRRNLQGPLPAIHEGSVWTTDAPYRETVGKVRTYQREGILAVEMEVAALFAVAEFRGIRLAAALVVSDELHSLKWVHGFKSPVFAQSRDRLVKAALETVRCVHQSLAPSSSVEFSPHID